MCSPDAYRSRVCSRRHRRSISLRCDTGPIMVRKQCDIMYTFAPTHIDPMRTTALSPRSRGLASRRATRSPGVTTVTLGHSWRLHCARIPCSTRLTPNVNKAKGTARSESQPCGVFNVVGNSSPARRKVVPHRISGLRSALSSVAREPASEGCPYRAHSADTVPASAPSFSNWQACADCHIRWGGRFASDGIAYRSENVSEDSFNELLTVEPDQYFVYVKATIGTFHGNRDSRLTDEGAAEHLWTISISPIQR